MGTYGKLYIGPRTKPAKIGNQFTIKRFQLRLNA